MLGIADCSCSGSLVEVTLIGSSDYNSEYRYYYIYEGSSTSGILKWSREQYSHNSFTDYICLHPGVYTLSLHSSNSYNQGTLTIQVGSSIIGYYTTTYYETTYQFFIPTDNPISSWQYTSIPQITTSWTTATLDWQSMSTFPSVTTVTRYFRYSFTIDETESYYAVRLSFITQTGFRCYFNGEIAFDWNMPSGEITPSTPATNTTTGIARSYSTLMSYLAGPINNKYFIAVEVHAAETTVSGDETFQGFISLIDEDDMIINSSGDIASYPTSGLTPEEGADKLFDGDLNTKWYFSLTDIQLPVWAAFSTSNQGHELVNKYSVSTADSHPMRDCVSWNLYGSQSMDHNNWVLLDSRTNVLWTARKQTKVYALANTVSYSNYIFQCTAISGGSSVTFFQMSEVSLMLSSPSSHTSSTIEYPGFSYTIPTNAYFTLSPTTAITGQFSLVNSTLPHGLTLDTSSGTISGIPTTSYSPQLVTVEVVTADNTALLQLLLAVIVPPTSFSYSSSVLTIYIGNEVTLTPSYDGDSSTFILLSGTLPTGLTLDSVTGTIIGIPTAAEDKTVVVKVENQVGSTTTSLVLNIEEPPVRVSYPQSSYILAKGEEFFITPTVYNSTSAFSVHAGVLPQGLTLNPTTGVISGTPSESYSTASVTVSGSQDGVTVTATVSFQVLTKPASLQYEQTSFLCVKGKPFSTIPTVTGDSLSFSLLSGSLPTGYSLNPSSGAISGVSNQGPFTASVVIKAENVIGSVTASVILTVMNESDLFSYPGSPITVSRQQSASINPICYSTCSNYMLYAGLLPQGLTLNTSTGVISGTPTETISSTISIMATQGSVSVSTTITIITVSPPFIEYPQTHFNLTTGASFSVTPTITGDSVTVSSVGSSLPSGLSLNSYSGVISGYPTTYTTRVITIKAENSVGSMVVTLFFDIFTPPSSFRYPKNSYTFGCGEQVSISPIYNSQSPHFSVTTGSLPEGLFIDPSTGVITGTTKSDYSSSFEVTLSNGVGSITFVLSITIVSAPSELTYPNLAYSLVVDEAFSITPTYKGKGAFGVYSGALPDGILLDMSSGIISGIPTEEMDSSVVEIYVSNAVGEDHVSLTFRVGTVSLDHYLLIIETVVLVILAIIIIILMVMYCVLKGRTNPTHKKLVKKNPRKTLTKEIPVESSRDDHPPQDPEVNIPKTEETK